MELTLRRKSMATIMAMVNMEHAGNTGIMVNTAIMVTMVYMETTKTQGRNLMDEKVSSYNHILRHVPAFMGTSRQSY